MTNKDFKGDDDGEEKEKLILEIRRQLDIETSGYINENDLEATRRIKAMLDKLEELTDDKYLDQFDKQRLLDDFKRNYQPTLEAQFRLKQDKADNKPKNTDDDFIVRTYKRGGIFSKICVFTVVFFFAFSITHGVTKTIAGIDVFNIVTSWTDDVFDKDYTVKTSSNLNDENNPNYKSYKSIEDVEEDLGVEILRLKGIPRGFKIDEITLLIEAEDQNINRVNIKYTKKDKFFFYRICVAKNIGVTPQISIEKIKDDADLYMIGEIEHYILKNNKWPTVTWVYNNIDYTLTGNLAKEEFLNIVDNLYK